MSNSPDNNNTDNMIGNIDSIMENLDNLPQTPENFQMLINVAREQKGIIQQQQANIQQQQAKNAIMAEMTENTIKYLGERDAALLEIDIANAKLNTLYLQQVEMRVSAEISEERAKRYISVAIHKLKSPLQQLEVIARSVLDYITKGNLVDKEDAIAKAKEQGNTEIIKFLTDGSFANLKFEDEVAAENFVRKVISLVKGFGDLKKLAEYLQVNPEDFENIDIELEEREIEELASTIVGKYSQLAQQKNVSLNYRVNSPNQFMKVHYLIVLDAVSNLLSNAFKYTEKDKGQIDVDFTIIKESEDKTILRVVVRDNGAGMTQGQMNKVFIANAEPGPMGGTHLGLASTKDHLNQIGGEIKVESKLEEGSTFTLDIPIKLFTLKH